MKPFNYHIVASEVIELPGSVGQQWKNLGKITIQGFSRTLGFKTNGSLHPFVTCARGKHYWQGAREVEMQGLGE